MKIYTDLLGPSHDEILSDSYEMTVVEKVFYEGMNEHFFAFSIDLFLILIKNFFGPKKISVKAKMVEKKNSVEVNIGANPVNPAEKGEGTEEEEEGLEDKGTTMVINVVEGHRLVEVTWPQDKKRKLIFEKKNAFSLTIIFLLF